MLVDVIAVRLVLFRASCSPAPHFHISSLSFYVSPLNSHTFLLNLTYYVSAA